VGKWKVNQTRKGIEEVVEYALGHRIRIQILVALNEGSYTAAQIAEKIDEPQEIVQNHLRQMLDDGSIEVDEERRRGNRIQYTYRSVVVNTFTAEEFERLPYRFRQNIVGAILNSGIAEILASFHAGKLAEPRAHEYWDWYNMDKKGQDDADALTHRFLRDIRDIEDESLARAAKSGEETISMVLELFFFERTRKGGNRPHRFVIDELQRCPGRHSQPSRALCLATSVGAPARPSMSGSKA
jgi:DNA-binding transcriptional ArsR family regulator